MTATDVVAILALLIAGASLGLEVRRWFEAGPKIVISMIADALVIPDDGGGPRVAITVYNRGNAPTTITHMVVYGKHPWWQVWRGKKRRFFAGIVNASSQPIPSEIGVNQRWMGMMTYDEKTVGLRRDGHLYVGVICSHSTRDFLKRVPRPKPDGPAKRLSEAPGELR